VRGPTSKEREGKERWRKGEREEGEERMCAVGIFNYVWALNPHLTMAVTRSGKYNDCRSENGRMMTSRAFDPAVTSDMEVCPRMVHWTIAT